MSSQIESASHEVPKSPDVHPPESVTDNAMSIAANTYSLPDSNDYLKTFQTAKSGEESSLPPFDLTGTTANSFQSPLPWNESNSDNTWANKQAASTAPELSGSSDAGATGAGELAPNNLNSRTMDLDKNFLQFTQILINVEKDLALLDQDLLRLLENNNQQGGGGSTPAKDVTPAEKAPPAVDTTPTTPAPTTGDDSQPKSSEPLPVKDPAPVKDPTPVKNPTPMKDPAPTKDPPVGESGGSATGLSSTLQNVVNSMDLKANLSGHVVDNVTGYGGSGTIARPMDAYGSPDGKGGFTIDKNPPRWGVLTTDQSFTGTQLLVADVKFNPKDVKSGENAWPSVWGLSGWNEGSNLNQEVDAMEYFNPNATKEAGSTLHNWIKGDKAESTTESEAIPNDLFANAATNGVEVGALIDAKDHLIKTFVGGKETAEFNVPAGSPALTTPMSWLFGTGNGENMDVTNLQIYTPQGGGR